MLENGMLELCPSMLFATFTDLEEHLQTYSLQKGFTFKKASAHHYKKETDEGKKKISQRFPVGSLESETNFIQRGTFKCTSAASGSCKFEVRFTHVLDENDNVYKYIIKKEGFNLEHSGHTFKVTKTDTVS
jgi:hypothetical protein